MEERSQLLVETFVVQRTAVVLVSKDVLIFGSIEFLQAKKKNTFCINACNTLSYYVVMGGAIYRTGDNWHTNYNLFT